MPADFETSIVKRVVREATSPGSVTPKLQSSFEGNRQVEVMGKAHPMSISLERSVRLQALMSRTFWNTPCIQSSKQEPAFGDYRTY